MQALPTLMLGSLLFLPAPAHARQGERYTLEADDVAIYNLAGSLTVEAGTGPVSVTVIRRGTDAAQLRVERGELGGTEALRLVYPGDAVVYAGMERGSSTTLKVREDGTFGDESSRGHRGRTVKISAVGAGLRAHADLTVRMPPGSRVSLHLAVGAVSIAQVNGEIVVDGHSTPVTASGTKGHLVLDVGSGAVRVTDAEGTVNVDTGSGGVEVSRFRGGELSIDTGSGRVVGSDLQAGEIRIDTGSGDIELTAVTSPVLTLETGSGGVAAELRGTLRELAVETGSGDISVRAPASLAAEVEIETASGGIETDFALQVTRHSPDHVVGRIGDGVGRVAIETGSGDVRLLKTPS